MKKWLCLLLAVLMLMLSGCDMVDLYDVFERDPERTDRRGKWGIEEILETKYARDTEPTNTPATETTVPTTHTTVPPTTEVITQPEPPTHSALYIPGVETEDVIRWYNEVALDAEYVNGGDATLVQKWSSGISYALLGEPTEEDRRVLSNMVTTLNSISGFPGMYETTDPGSANLKIHFVSESEMLDIMGSDYAGNDGAVTFWYDGNNSIYTGVICIRTDLDQYVRNSVIQEEIYNGMGPAQDTDLRSDSLIYSGYSTPQQMTQVDLLIMKLLYHPHIRCGMTAAECEKVIRQLYY